MKITLQKAYNSWQMKYTGRSAQWGLFTWRIMASHNKRLENLQKDHFCSPGYTYLTISFILSPAMMFTTSESVTRLQEVTILILQECEKSRDSIGYHCLFWSPSQGDNIWNSPSPPMDEIFCGAGQRGLGRGVGGVGLYLWGVYWSWHTATLCKLTENLCLRSLINAVNFFKRIWWTPP